MSILEAREAKGEARAIRQTCIRMMEKGFDDAEIRELLDVDDDYLDALRDELKD